MSLRSALRPFASSTLLRLALSMVLAGYTAFPATRAEAFGTPAMLKNIAPGAAASTPQGFLKVGTKLVFFADDGSHGIEPWVSDGTPLGTFMLRDIQSGPGGGFNPGCPECNAVSNGSIAYFSGFDGTSGSQLWRTDGTTAGTFKVSANSVATGLAVVGANVYFTGNGGLLYKSDGTDAGTGSVSATPPAFSAGYGITDVNGTVFFPGSDGFSGVELWKTDGTQGGTVRVKDLNPGSANAGLGSLTNVGGVLYFTGTNGPVAGLFRSDGTSAGTVLVKAIGINAGDADHPQIVGVGNTAYCIAYDAASGVELWKSDGTALGTVLVKDIYPGDGPGIPSGNAGTGLVAIGSTVYFRAADATHGYELWKSNGTEAGTVMVRDINSANFGGSTPASLANVDGTLFFRAMSSFAAGTQPWTSDGTSAGTVQLSSIYPANNSAAASFKQVNGTIFFSADDGTNGIELWSLASPLLAVDPPVADLLERLELSPANPNPATSNTRIAYTLPISERATLRLFDVRGRAVRTLIDEEQSAGRHSLRLDARGLASGVYFVKLEAGSIVRQRKVVLQR